MIFSKLISKEELVNESAGSLYDEKTFYDAFIKDVNKCRSELIIESPFITTKRSEILLPTIIKLKASRVRVVINTKDPQEHDGYMQDDCLKALSNLQKLGVYVIYTENHHRKIAIIDRKILWEGSLNILSQNISKEMMRRIYSPKQAWDMIRFAELDKLIS